MRSSPDPKGPYYCSTSPDHRHIRVGLKCRCCGVKFKRRWRGGSMDIEADKPNLEGSPAGIVIPAKGSLSDVPGLEGVVTITNNLDKPIRLERIRIGFGMPKETP